jgi:acyl-CoA reductase-like NAD-dependent aldehyde dehydrogenase
MAGLVTSAIGRRKKNEAPHPMSTFATVNPTNGIVVRRFPTLSDEGVRRALESSERAYRDWARADLADRAEVLRTVAGLYRQHAAELAKLTTLEVGKPITQALTEVELAASIYESYAALRSGHSWGSCRGTFRTTTWLGSSHRTSCWVTRF